MQKRNKRNNNYCFACGGTGLAPDKYSDPNQLGRCPVCGTSIRYKGIEIKVEGTNSIEVKEVTEHLLTQASLLETSKNTSSSFKTKLMGLFSKKVKCKRFYEIQSRTLDITGLKMDLPQKFDLGLGSFKLDSKYQETSEQLKTLDLLQYGLCNDINGVTDVSQKDKLLQKIIETKTKMLEIVLSLNNPNGNGTGNKRPLEGATIELDQKLIEKTLALNTSLFQFSQLKNYERAALLLDEIADLAQFITEHKHRYADINSARQIVELQNLLAKMKLNNKIETNAIADIFVRLQEAVQRLLQFFQ